jgi:putative Mg2+ transporter-C (MgtC) family protein
LIIPLTMRYTISHNAWRKLGSAARDPGPCPLGFIAAGAIFVAHGNVRNLTTAANVWLATAVGIAAGAGQFGLAVIATVFGVVIVTVVGVVERFLPRRSDRHDE